MTLLAVSKSQDIDKIKDAYKYGQKDFGENYIQEAINKINNLKDLNINWHFIGKVQSNKSKLIAENFSWVHSIDKITTLEKINNFRKNISPNLNVCIQINADEEKTKSGIKVSDVENFLKDASSFQNINLRGLMAIPKYQADSLEQYNTFMKIKVLFDSLRKKGYKLDTLSIGMSADYESAIAAGSTIVRIGTAIFGERKI